MRSAWAAKSTCLKRRVRAKQPECRAVAHIADKPRIIAPLFFVGAIQRVGCHLHDVMREVLKLCECVFYVDGCLAWALFGVHDGVVCHAASLFVQFLEWAVSLPRVAMRIGQYINHGAVHPALGLGKVVGPPQRGRGQKPRKDVWRKSRIDVRAHSIGQVQPVKLLQKLVGSLRDLLGHIRRGQLRKR